MNSFITVPESLKSYDDINNIYVSDLINNIQIMFNYHNRIYNGTHYTLDKMFWTYDQYLNVLSSLFKLNNENIIQKLKNIYSPTFYRFENNNYHFLSNDKKIEIVVGYATNSNKKILHSTLMYFILNKMILLIPNLVLHFGFFMIDGKDNNKYIFDNKYETKNNKPSFIIIKEYTDPNISYNNYININESYDLKYKKEEVKFQYTNMFDFINSFSNFNISPTPGIISLSIYTKKVQIPYYTLTKKSQENLFLNSELVIKFENLYHSFINIKTKKYEKNFSSITESNSLIKAVAFSPFYDRVFLESWDFIKKKISSYSGAYDKKSESITKNYEYLTVCNDYLISDNKDYNFNCDTVFDTNTSSKIKKLEIREDERISNYLHNYYIRILYNVVETFSRLKKVQIIKEFDIYIENNNIPEVYINKSNLEKINIKNILIPDMNFVEELLKNLTNLNYKQLKEYIFYIREDLNIFTFNKEDINVKSIKIQPKDIPYKLYLMLDKVK